MPIEVLRIMERLKTGCATTEEQIAQKALIRSVEAQLLVRCRVPKAVRLINLIPPFFKGSTWSRGYGDDKFRTYWRPVPTQKQHVKMLDDHLN